MSKKPKYWRYVLRSPSGEVLRRPDGSKVFFQTPGAAKDYQRIMYPGYKVQGQIVR